MKLINELLLFILIISKKYNIDESHDISHSMDILLLLLHFANDIVIVIDILIIMSQLL